ncbi:MAG: hypothetical protein IJD01_02385 [Clostridia bacterium]|nr:hypothetical protein [Clostridia bacterium]
MFRRLAYRFQQYMIGRYGQDELSRFLLILSFILLIVSSVLRFVPVPFLYFIVYLLAMAALLWCTARMFSRNIPARQRERERYLRTTGKIKTWFRLRRRMWRERKTHRFFKCPSCRAVIRVAKGQGDIDVGCPRCKHRTKLKT